MAVTKQFPPFFAPYCLALEKSVGAVVYRRSEQGRLYLLLHYPGEGPRGGHWDFPKGHVEKGESEQETMRREVQEETGMRDLTIISGFRNLTSYFYIARSNEREERKREKRCIFIYKRVVFYLIETKENVVTISDEHLDHLWLSFGKAREKLTYHNARHVLCNAEKHFTRTL